MSHANTLETLASLQDEHPRPGVAYNHPPPNNVIGKALHVDQYDILRAIRSFPAGSSGGPDGLRPQHILELVTCREAGAELVMAITVFTNVLLEGSCHADVGPILCGGFHIALQKKSGGLHLATPRSQMRQFIAELADLFNPIQLGVGVLRGCEAAVHAARGYAEDMPDDRVIVKA